MKNFFSNAFRGANVVVGIFLSFIIATVLLHAAQITFSSGDVISADDMNSNFTELYNKVSTLESEVSTLSSENDTLESSLSDVSTKADSNETEISGLNTTKIFDDAGVFLGFYLGTDGFNNIEVLTTKGYIYCINQIGEHVLSGYPDRLMFTDVDGLGDCYGGANSLPKVWSTKRVAVMVVDGVTTIYEFSGQIKDTVTYYSLYTSTNGLGSYNEPCEMTSENHPGYPLMEITTFEATGVPESITSPIHLGGN